jgi:predicted enzyme related to lactoylglutathione lyase
MEMTKTRLAMSPVSAVIQAVDLDRAKRFYQETLGLEIEEGGMPDGFLVHGGGGTQFLVYHSEQTRPAEQTVAMWQVDDLREVMAEQRARGITFEEFEPPLFKTTNGIAEDEQSYGSWFKDSEGNVISLMQMKQ